MIFKFWNGAKYLSEYKKNRVIYKSDRYLARFEGKIDFGNVHVWGGFLIGYI